MKNKYDPVQEGFFQDEVVKKDETDEPRQHRLRKLVHGMRGEGELEGYRLVKTGVFSGGYWVTEASFIKLFDKQQTPSNLKE
jgi:hypothetical protein